MRILEVRDGFLKFEADKSIYLSSFIQIDGLEKSYIAQVIQLKRSGENSIGYGKILFLYDGALQSYDKTLPSKDSEIKEFTFNILNNSINAEKPVIIGKTQGSDLNITIDESAFNKKMLISVDDKEINNILARNLVKQFNNLSKNVVIIDSLGIINAKKIVAGVDFKLPLDTASLAFMYQDCLNDATADSKSMIIDIFKDLSEYSQTVPFVPFETLKTIVDDMVDKSHVFKLLVLKNKLAKFDRLGYFAKNKNEVEALKHILNSKCTIIDISKLDSAFQNRYLAFIYEMLSKDTHVLLELSNTVSKKNIKDILQCEKSTTFITHSRFKYLNDIKNVFDNFIIAPSIANNEIFDIYSTFLKSMPKDTYLIAGEAINYIPLVSQVKVIDEVVEIEKEDEAILENIVEDDLENENISEENLGEDEIIDETELEEVSEPEIEEQENVQIVEQPSNEEILANIEEKSNDVISKAAEDLVIPTSVNMFNDEEEETPEIVEELPEEITDAEIQINEADLEDPEVEEIPLAESFSTAVHQDEEIQDYIPLEENAVQEISLDDEVLETDEFSEIVEKPEQEFEPEFSETLEIKEEVPEIIENNNDEIIEEEDENSIELDDDIDLDLNSEIEEVPQELEQNVLEPVEENSLNVLPISDDANFDNDLEEIVELNPDDIDDNDIVVDLEDEKELDENVDEQIVKDVDKVFTTRKDDDISDSDLDFIDELNSDDEDGVLEELQDDSALEELTETEDNGGILEEINDEQPQLEEINDEQEILQTRNSSTPIVPVYDAEIPQEDLVMSDPIQQGDTVTHAKYGTGVVEKMIKYGNKTLFSINFDNIGRRLLDPTLTEIKKA